MTAVLRTACVAALLGACTPVANAPLARSSSPAASVAQDRSALVATDLAAADLAFEQGDTAALAPLLTRLRAQGAHPLDASDGDPVAQWEAATGTDEPPFRGRVLGPGYSRGRLAPGANAVLQQTFFSGQKTALSIGERNPATLRLRVFDSKSRLVCEHAPAHGKVCRFTPIFTQRYKIEIRNGGQRDAVYYLAVE